MLFYYQPFFLQIFALFMGLVYLKTDNNYIQEDIMNINGVIFLLIISYTYNNLFPVLNVSFPPINPGMNLIPSTDVFHSRSE